MTEAAKPAGSKTISAREWRAPGDDQVFFELVTEIAVRGALHDRLRSGKLDRIASSLPS